MKARILQVAVLVFVVLSALNHHLASAQNFGGRVEISPEDPTELDDVEVQVSFYFRTDPPNAVNFSSVIQNENVFKVNVTVLVPRKDWVRLEVPHTDSFTYHLGRLDAGNYIFEVYVKTIHGSDQFWLEKEVEFSIAPSEATMPEFPSNIWFLLMLILTATSILLMKKFTET